MTKCRYFYVDADLFYFQITFLSQDLFLCHDSSLMPTNGFI